MAKLTKYYEKHKITDKLSCDIKIRFIHKKVALCLKSQSYF